MISLYIHPHQGWVAAAQTGWIGPLGPPMKICSIFVFFRFFLKTSFAGPLVPCFRPENLLEFLNCFFFFGKRSVLILSIHVYVNSTPICEENKQFFVCILPNLHSVKIVQPILWILDINLVQQNVKIFQNWSKIEKSWNFWNFSKFILNQSLEVQGLPKDQK